MLSLSIVSQLFALKLPFCIQYAGVPLFRQTLVVYGKDRAVGKLNGSRIAHIGLCIYSVVKAVILSPGLAAVIAYHCALCVLALGTAAVAAYDCAAGMYQ